VLSLRINLENKLRSRLDCFYNQEVPTAFEEKRLSLVNNVFNLLSELRIKGEANVNAKN
jgi:hypothetical protein